MTITIPRDLLIALAAPDVAGDNREALIPAMFREIERELNALHAISPDYGDDILRGIHALSVRVDAMAEIAKMLPAE